MPDLSLYERSRAHQARAHRLIPGGAHTYAKGDDQMPEAMPVVIARGDGCAVWDVDGNPYIEYGMGLRAVTLGHAHPRVTAAAAAWLTRGTNFSRPASIELVAAEAFLDAVPGAETVKFCKDGSAATTAAVTLARAHTGRDLVAVCADHPFLSQHDWFIGTTPLAAGIPEAVRRLTVTFPYGDAAALAGVLDAHAGEVACVVMEAVRGPEDPSDYLAEVRRVCDERGVVWVLDEMITGFRWHAGGAQSLYGLRPDLSTFGKALANGHSVSALAGRRDLMAPGGLDTEADRVFLLSATHGAETHSLAAAVATLEVYRDEPIVETMERQGARLRDGIQQAATAAGVADHVCILGRPSNLVYTSLDAEGVPSQAFRTLLLQELTARGVLAPSLVVSAAHTDEAIDATVDAFSGALAVYRRALDGNTTDGLLVGRPVQPVFRSRAGLVWSESAPHPSTETLQPVP